MSIYWQKIWMKCQFIDKKYEWNVNLLAKNMNEM